MSALRRLAPLAAAVALCATTARADEPSGGEERVHLELFLAAHGGLHSVMEDALNPKDVLPVFGAGLWGFVVAGPMLLGAGVDGVTLVLEGDALAYGAAGLRREVSPGRSLTLLALAGAHHVSDCVDSMFGEGCNPGANLPFVGGRLGYERCRPGEVAIGAWLMVARDTETRHVPEAMRSPTYGGTVALLSLSVGLGGER
jgi:hypothetical protein